MGNKITSVVRVLNVQSESTQSVMKMMWPFTAHLPRVLNAGDKINITGVIAEDAEIFSINLVCEHDLSTKPPTVAYHHKLMFNEERTILNSKQDGTWQEEEHNEDMPIKPGENFDIMLLIDSDGIYAYYDNNHHSIFPHRVPYEDIRYVQIWHGLGRVDSMKVTFA